MTTIALNYSTRILEGSWNVVKKTLQGIMLGYAIARQTQANRYVAEQLSRYEYNGEKDWVNLNDLNQRTIQELQKEFAND